MAAPQLPDPAKLFVAILFGEERSLPAALQRLQDCWGTIDFQGPDRPFDMTDYYEPEMGPSLRRRLVTFAELVPPEILRHAKPQCNAIEDALATGTRRTVNLDVGVLDHNKIILASCKGAGQKIHLGDGIYADLVARFARGRYQPFEWTFPDFKDGRYDAELAEIRSRYLTQLRGRRKQTK